MLIVLLLPFGEEISKIILFVMLPMVFVALVVLATECVVLVTTA